MHSRYDARSSDLAELLADEPAYRARQAWDGLHRRGLDPEDITELPRSLRARLATALPPALAPAVQPVPRLEGPVGGLAGQHLGHVRRARVVPAGHRGPGYERAPQARAPNSTAPVLGGEAVERSCSARTGPTHCGHVPTGTVDAW